MPTQSPLFREQVVAAHQDALGQPIAWQPGQRRVVALCLCLLTGLAGWFVLTIQYADKVSVRGLVAPTAKPVVVRSRASGHVVALQATANQVVAAGASVARIATAQLDARGRSLGEDHAQRLREQRAHLLAEREVQAQLMAKRDAVLAARAVRLTRAVASQDERLRLAELSRASQARRRSRARSLAAQGWLSADEVANVETAWLAVRERLAALRRERLEDDARRAEATLARDELAAQWALEEARLHGRVSELEFSLRSANASDATLVVAPVSGRVADVFAHEGVEVEPGEALLSIQPHANDHVIETYLPSAAAGRVRAGMRARVRYSGYPQHEFGAAVGVVERVGDVAREFDGGLAYLCRVRILQRPSGIDHTPAGMQVAVDLLLDVRSLKDRLLTPLSEFWARV